MNAGAFVEEVERRLLKIFRGSKEGYTSSEVDRRHLEGFIQAGVFLELTTNHEIKQMMEAIHHDVFGQSVATRKRKKPISWPEEAVDYSKFELPISFR